MARKNNDPINVGCQPQGTHTKCLREIKGALERLKSECEGGGWRSSEDKVINRTGRGTQKSPPSSGLQRFTATQAHLPKPYTWRTVQSELRS